MSVSMLEASPTPPAYELYDDFCDAVTELDLSGNEMRVLLHLAKAMGTGNRVPISKARIAAALGISRPTVARCIDALLAARLLLEPDDGLPMVNPVYFAHNAAERDQLVDRFGTAAVKARRAHGGAAEPKASHLRLVQ